MGVLTLNIEFKEKGLRKAMQFEPGMVVYDACGIIREKVGATSGNSKDYGLFRVEDDPSKCVWMENGRTLEYYLIRDGDTLEYKNKIRQLRVRSLDGGSVKTVYVDESQPVAQLMITICSKMGISNHEEFSLVRTSPAAQNGKNGWAEENGREKREQSTFMNTIGRKKEKQMTQLRAKLHTDDEIQWVDHSKTLREQNIGDDEELVLRRKFFFSDTNVDTRDPVQLNLLYQQCRDGVLKGLHPVSRETAIKLAALQCYIEYGPFQEGVQKSINAKELLPKEYAKAKEHEKNIVQEYRELMYEDPAAPKKKYVELCQSLPTYGVTFFLVKEKEKGKNQLVPRLLGINKDSVLRLDAKTKAVLKEWPLEQVRRWAASVKGFTLDFGDYKDGYYSVKTPDGEKIAALIAGYIDIILKKKRIADHLGIEGDEGSTMLEDVVAPAKATLIAHGELGQGYAQDGHVALPGVLRSAAGTPAGPGGAQYGAVSGMVITQELPKGERVRYVDSQERSQRALIGTIEATIRAVEEAEEEIAKPPQLDLPRFDTPQRKWRVEVEKEAVGDRLASMGAATAQIVQLTAIPDEMDQRVGTAIATIGSNLPEMGRGVRELAAMMPDERRAGDLVDAARKLCGAFGNFLDRVHPEHQEKRPNILSAASRVGELSHDVMNTMHDETVEDKQFHDQLIQRAKNVATSTAQLVLQAKTVSADCEEPALKEQVIHSATKTAYATSELVACARVVAPTIDHPPCQERLTEAAHNVARAVEDLLVDANNATKRSISGTGEKQYGDIHAAARQVTSALDQLIDHVKTSPRQQGQLHRKVQEDYNYEEILRTSNRLITQQAPPRDMLRDSESAIRHSRILVEQMESEAAARPDQRDRLLNAARVVAEATSNMIDATKECQTRPQEAEAQVALKTAAENLVQATSEATSDRITQQTIQRLEKAAKDTSAAATQTISAAHAAQPHIQSRRTVETLIIECTETGRVIPPVITSIKESQASQTPGERFRSQSSLIHETNQLVTPASRLVEVARSAVPEVADTHVAAHLQATTQQLTTHLAELRVALNNAQQVAFDLQLEHSEDLIRELDKQLQDVGNAAKQGRLAPPPGVDSERASSNLVNAARQVSSSLAQLISAAHSNDRQHIGASAAEAGQSLRGFTTSVHGVAATRPDVPLDKLIVNARSVVHDSGRIFDRVREQAPISQLDDAARTVSTSLRQTLACLPDNAVIEKAIEQVRGAQVTQREPVDLRVAATKLIESSSELVVRVRAPQQAGNVDVFVRSYTDFHTAVVQQIQGQSEQQIRQQLAQDLQSAQDQAVNVLVRLRSATADASNVAHTQALAQSSRGLADVVNVIVDRVSAGRETPWLRECDSALQQIESVRHVLDEALLPVNNNSYYESLEAVTEQAKRLGEGMSGMAHYARREDTEALCTSVRTAADAVCGLAENAAQSAYLIGAGDPQSQPGKPPVFDSLRLDRSVQTVKAISERIEHGEYTQAQLINDATTVATHTSTLATICRDASERSTSVNVKKQFVNCARDITSATASLITAVKNVQQLSDSSRQECAEHAHRLRLAAENLETFVDNPEFGPVPARISQAGRQAQQPVLQSGRQMLDASCEMIRTAKNLAARPTDAATWQRIADNSRVVSDSIKQLVAAIRDEAPGQADLDAAIQRLNQLIQQVDQASLAAAQQQLPRSAVTEQRVHQQILHASQTLSDKIEPLKNASVSRAEEIGYTVREHMTAIEPLVQSSIQAASLADSRTQSSLFDQCKTVMLYAAKDSGGNPKARELHTIVEESAEQLREAITDLQRSVNVMDSEAGVYHGIVETITRSIALTDQSRQAPAGDSFADAQTRMIDALDEISRIATDMPLTDPSELGQLSLRLAERYKQLAEDARVAQNLLTSQNLAQKLKVAVQKLGTACIELVKNAGQRRAHPEDERIYQQLGNSSGLTVERVREVLAALNEGSRGTQACINAANTVSGIIGDLDTSIMFATSGSLNPARPPGAPIDFSAHRDAIVKTAKALVEDTKALVTGAASNQEQLAVAAQNAVRTIVHLCDAVKNGAATLSEDSAESQVLVIHAARDVAAALSNLIQATKHASGRSPQDPAMSNLKEAAKLMVTNVSSLLRTIKSVEDSSQRGAQALDASVNAIELAIRQYDSNETPGRHAASAEEVIRATRSVTEATARAAGAASSMQQEQVIAAANLARQAVGELLNTTRAAAQNAENAELKYKTLNAGREVALQVKQLLSTLYFLLSRPDDREAKNALLTASREVAKAVGDLAQCGEQLRADTWTDGTDAAAIAENELLGAASSIEAAAVKLAHLRPRQVHVANQPDENLPFDEQILAAAKSIAAAVQTLVKAASSAQRELIAQGRMEQRPALHSDDYQWSEGLISAAKLVAAAVHQLCDAANGLVQGHATEEKLISAAKQVASSTAHLLVACKVKSDIDSRAMQRLQTAGHAVKTATEHLVNAARQSVTEDERTLVISDRMVTGIAQVMDAQEEVLRKEKELTEARTRLAAINKSRYEKSPEPF